MNTKPTSPEIEKIEEAARSHAGTAPPHEYIVMKHSFIEGD